MGIDEKIAKRLDRVTRTLDEVNRENFIISHSLNRFIRHQLIMNSALPQPTTPHGRSANSVSRPLWTGLRRGSPRRLTTTTRLPGNGEPLTVRSQLAHTHPVKSFFRWLTRENHILYNPASDLDMPRIGRRLPLFELTAAEAERVLAVPNLRTPVGIRDRAILETLYSTGVRRAELINLNVYDIDAHRGVVIVRQVCALRHRRSVPGSAVSGLCDCRQGERSQPGGHCWAA